MGRKLKYKSDAERRKAQRKWQAEHYERNKSEILRKARETYQRKKLEKGKQERMKRLYDED